MLTKVFLIIKNNLGKYPLKEAIKTGDFHAINAILSSEEGRMPKIDLVNLSYITKC